MKRFLLVSSMVVLGSAFCFADMSTSTGTVSGAKTGPCREIMQACKDAGFTRDGHDNGNKGLMQDCMKPILAGQSVEGVTVDPSIAGECKAMKARQQQKHSMNQGTVPSKAQPQNTPSQGQ